MNPCVECELHASSKIKYLPHVNEGVGELVFFLVRPHKPAKDVNLTSLASVQAVILEYGQENLSLMQIEL